MSLILTSAPSVEPVTLDIARQHCKADSTDDALLAIYITAARQMVEERCNRALIHQTWVQTLDRWPDLVDIKLLKARVSSITSVTYVDTAGATQTLPSTAYVLDPDASPAGWLLPADGTTWPDTDDVINAIRITMVCGYGADGDAVPAAIRQWMLLTIGLLYDQRTAVDASGRATALPSRFVDSLLDPYVVYL